MTAEFLKEFEGKEVQVYVKGNSRKAFVGDLKLSDDQGMVVLTSKTTEYFLMIDDIVVVQVSK
jgi:hypothetical protein